jgi:hypothetical protein
MFLTGRTRALKKDCPADTALYCSHHPVVMLDSVGLGQMQSRVPLDYGKLEGRGIPRTVLLPLLRTG